MKQGYGTYKSIKMQAYGEIPFRGPARQNPSVTKILLDLTLCPLMAAFVKVFQQQSLQYAADIHAVQSSHLPKSYRVSQ